MFPYTCWYEHFFVFAVCETPAQSRSTHFSYALYARVCVRITRLACSDMRIFKGEDCQCGDTDIDIRDIARQLDWKDRVDVQKFKVRFEHHISKM
jgi:hypothetical protein